MSEACANIGPRERRLRNRVGVAGTLLTLLVAAALIETHAPWWARLFLVLPAFVAAMGFLQAREHVCVAFAKQGIRVLGDSREGAEKVQDDALAASIAASARRIYLQSAAVVAALVVVVLVIP